MRRRRFLLTATLAPLLPARARARAWTEDDLSTVMRLFRIPAVSVAIIRDGVIAQNFAIGAARETLFQAASISKVVTGQVILQLMERGRLDLDAPVKELANPFPVPVTPRLLLCHR